MQCSHIYNDLDTINMYIKLSREHTEEKDKSIKPSDKDVLRWVSNEIVW